MSDCAPRRRGYLDWIRGIAVLVMIEAHVLDSWTSEAARHTTRFDWSMILGGFGAPLFLFLAGVAVALAASSKLRASGDVRMASRAVVQRGLQVFGFAFLFRIQACILGWANLWTILRVDVLNIMGLAIIAAAAMWGLASGSLGRTLIFAVATLGVSLVTPIVRNARLVSALPDPVEAYIAPIPGLSNFVLFPWSAFLFGGALVGVLVDDARSRGDERRLNLTLGIGGAVLAVAAYTGSFLPTAYAKSDFWTSSPSFFFLRLGVILGATSLAYAWEAVQKDPDKWSPLRQMGRRSLFIYWIHVELVYGLISRPLRKGLSFGQAWTAYALFAFLMLLCSLGKDRAVSWWERQSSAPSLAQRSLT
jgi:uncharacterized membrane protein